MTRASICCLLLALAWPGMAAEPSSFRFLKEVQRGEAQPESILALTFDSDVYAATRPGFPDVRVFNAANQEVPCLVEKATETRTHAVRAACGYKVVSLKENADDLDVILRLDADATAADLLNIATPLTNYERRVRVFGSDDGVTWTPLVTDGLVFDYSRYMDVRNQEVRLPKNTYRELKVSIAGIADAKESPFLELTRKYHGERETERIERNTLERRPFRMDRISLWHEKSEKLSERDRTADYKVVEYRVEEDAKEKTTIVHITTRREPLTEFTLETLSRNFSRMAVVQVPVKRGGQTIWNDIARGAVSVVDFGGYRKQLLDLTFPEHRETDYRIVINNQDNPPLVITGVKARGNVYRAVFLAAANEPYGLGYGSEQASQPQYDAATVLAPIRQGQAAVEGQLGEQVVNANVVECPVCPASRLLNNRLFLGTLIAAMVALLGWALFHAARRINEIPK